MHPTRTKLFAFSLLALLALTSCDLKFDTSYTRDPDADSTSTSTVTSDANDGSSFEPVGTPVLGDSFPALLEPSELDRVATLHEEMHFIDSEAEASFTGLSELYIYGFTSTYTEEAVIPSEELDISETEEFAMYHDEGYTYYFNSHPLDREIIVEYAEIDFDKLIYFAKRNELEASINNFYNFFKGIVNRIRAIETEADLADLIAEDELDSMVLTKDGNDYYIAASRTGVEVNDDGEELDYIEESIIHLEIIDQVPMMLSITEQVTHGEEIITVNQAMRVTYQEALLNYPGPFTTKPSVTKGMVGERVIGTDVPLLNDTLELTSATSTVLITNEDFLAMYDEELHYFENGFIHEMNETTYLEYEGRSEPVSYTSFLFHEDDFTSFKHGNDPLVSFRIPNEDLDLWMYDTVYNDFFFEIDDVYQNIFRQYDLMRTFNYHGLPDFDDGVVGVAYLLNFDTNYYELSYGVSYANFNFIARVSYVFKVENDLITYAEETVALYGLPNSELIGYANRVFTFTYALALAPYDGPTLAD